MFRVSVIKIYESYVKIYQKIKSEMKDEEKKLKFKSFYSHKDA